MRRLFQKAVMVAVFAVFTQSALIAEEDSVEKKPTKEELFSQKNIRKLSETFGHMIQRSIDRSVVKLDIEGVIRGLQDAASGKEASMTESEYEQTVTLMEEYAFQEQADENLKKAEQFLEENGKKEAVVMLEEGLVQYEVLQVGDDEEKVVSEDVLADVYYTGKYADNTVFSEVDQKTGEPIEIDVKETIPGFRSGMSGMRVGEKRRICIHPSLGYGMSGQLDPNALLIFDVEVVDVREKPEDYMSDEEAFTDGDFDFDFDDIEFDDETDETDEESSDDTDEEGSDSYEDESDEEDTDDDVVDSEYDVE